MISGLNTKITPRTTQHNCQIHNVSQAVLGTNEET